MLALTYFSPELLLLPLVGGFVLLDGLLHDVDGVVRRVGLLGHCEVRSWREPVALKTSNATVCLVMPDQTFPNAGVFESIAELSDEESAGQ